MQSNAVSKSTKLAQSGAFHSLLCTRICLRVKMCSSSASASLVWMILLKTLLVMGNIVTRLQLLQSPKSPFLGNFTISPVFPASGIVSLSHISRNMQIKRRGVSVSLALSISAVTPSAPHAFPLFDSSFHLFHGRWIYTDIQVLCCRWNLNYLFRFWPI